MSADPPAAWFLLTLRANDLTWLLQRSALLHSLATPVDISLQGELIKCWGLTWEAPKRV